MQMEQLQKDMIAAMKARDKVRKDAISSLVSAAKKAAIDEGCRDNIPEDLVNKVILKEMKSVKEQIDTCPATRTDLLDEYNTRYAIFEEYAPAMMSAEEVEKDDRDDGKNKNAHHGTHINRTITAFKILDSNRNSDVFFQIQYKVRKQVVVPNPHSLKNCNCHTCWLQNWKHYTKESLQRIAAIDHCCLFNLYWNRLDKTSKHKY